MSDSEAGSPAAPELIWRPNTSGLTPRQVRDLRQAFAAVARDGTYAQIAGIHGLPGGYGQHHTVLFLPWHRAYLVQLERALRQAVGEVAIPAWDWWNQPSLPPAFVPDVADGQPNPLYSSEIPPDVVKELQGRGNVSDPGPARTIRMPGAAVGLPDRNALQYALSAVTFMDFAARIEAVHDQLHIWVGGTSAEIPRSAYDPINWPISASIDQAWRVNIQIPV